MLFIASLLVPVLSSCRNGSIDQTSFDSSYRDSIFESPNSFSLNGQVSYEIQSDIKKVYLLGEIIDLSSSFILEKKGDEEIGRVSFDDASVSIDGIDTETEGNKTLSIRYENFHTEISYQVVTNYITLHLNGGRVPASSENKVLSKDDTISLPLYNDYADISSYNPVLEKDGETFVFTGWFYDAQLTKRATYQQDTEITSEESIDLYASYEKNSEGYFNYTINPKEKTCSIVSINFDQIELFFGLTELVIPSEIHGYPVTEIGQNIFVQYVGDTIDSPNDGFMDWGSFLELSCISFAKDSKIERIGKGAFKDMFNITSVTLPDSLKYIGDEAFMGCHLSSVRIPDNVEKIGKSAFFFNSLENITFGSASKLTILDEDAFASNSLLYEIQLPESLQEIRDGVFENCNLIENLYLPKSVSLVSPGSFKVMNGLKSIEVSEENPSFVSIEGNLYSKDKQKLIRYCLGKKDKVFIVPSFVKTIGDYAFKSFHSFCYLEKVNLPVGLTYIGKEAFYGCTFDIDLPQSLNSFALGAFYDFQGKKITVDSQSKKYSSQDGILYSKDKKKLYACPCFYNSSDFVLDDQVEMICEYAFCDIETMNSFTVSENSALKEIRKDGLLGNP